MVRSVKVSIAGIILFTNFTFPLVIHTKNGDVFSVLKICEPIEDPTDDTVEKSETQAGNGLIATSSSH